MQDSPFSYLFFFFKSLVFKQARNRYTQFASFLLVFHTLKFSGCDKATMDAVLDKVNSQCNRSNRYMPGRRPAQAFLQSGCKQAIADSYAYINRNCSAEKPEVVGVEKPENPESEPEETLYGLRHGGEPVLEKGVGQGVLEPKIGTEKGGLESIDGVAEPEIVPESRVVLEPEPATEPDSKPKMNTDSAVESSDILPKTKVVPEPEPILEPLKIEKEKEADLHGVLETNADNDYDKVTTKPDEDEKPLEYRVFNFHGNK